MKLMSDDTEDALDERLDSIQRRAENFRELLKDGEEVTIAFFDGELTVAESFRSQVERKYPKLYGRLMSIEAQLETGWLPYFAGLIGAGFVLFALQLPGAEAVLGKEVSDLLNRWWFYVVFPPSILYLISLGCGQWQKRIYRKHRAELLELIAHDRLDRDVLLVMLRDIGELDAIVQELKLDAGPFPPSEKTQQNPG